MPKKKYKRKKQIYADSYTKELRTRVHQRDGYICQLCGVANPKKLQCHHMDYDKMNSDMTNLITLCKYCNLKVNGRKAYWQDYFSKIVRS